MPYQFDTSKISLTTVQGYLNFASKFLTLSAGTLALDGYVKTAAAFGFILILVGSAQLVIATYQHDATKPTDSQGNPVPSSEVPVAK